MDLVGRFLDVAQQRATSKLATLGEGTCWGRNGRGGKEHRGKYGGTHD